MSTRLKTGTEINPHLVDAAAVHKAAINLVQMIVLHVLRDPEAVLELGLEQVAPAVVSEPGLPGIRVRCW